MSHDALNGSVALITGGTGGIGGGVAAAILEKGGSVVLGDLEESALEQAAAALDTGTAAGRVAALRLDVTQEESVRGALAWAAEKFGVVDVLVNNAGVCLAHPFLENDEKAYQATLDVNLGGTLRVSRLFAQRLLEAGRPGSIVNIASNAAKRPYARYVEYNASKAAIVSLTHTLSQELAPYDINVNAVCPGAVDTRMLEYCMREAIAFTGAAFDLAGCRSTWGPKQLGRLVRPEEVGRVVAFLASPAARVIRGQSISVDGGDTPF